MEDLKRTSDVRKLSSVNGAYGTRVKIAEFRQKVFMYRRMTKGRIKSKTLRYTVWTDSVTCFFMTIFGPTRFNNEVTETCPTRVLDLRVGY